MFSYNFPSHRAS